MSQRALHPTDHVQQDTHPTDNPQQPARKNGAGEARRRGGRRRRRPPSAGRHLFFVSARTIKRHHHPQRQDAAHSTHFYKRPTLPGTRTQAMLNEDAVIALNFQKTKILVTGISLMRTLQRQRMLAVDHAQRFGSRRVTKGKRTLALTETPLKIKVGPRSTFPARCTLTGKCKSKSSLHKR